MMGPSISVVGGTILPQLTSGLRSYSAAAKKDSVAFKAIESNEEISISDQQGNATAENSDQNFDDTDRRDTGLLLMRKSANSVSGLKSWFTSGNATSEPVGPNASVSIGATIERLGNQAKSASGPGSIVNVLI